MVSSRSLLKSSVQECLTVVPSVPALSMHYLCSARIAGWPVIDTDTKGVWGVDGSSVWDGCHLP